MLKRAINDLAFERAGLEMQSKMPLSHRGRHVALLFEQLRDGQMFVSDERLAVAIQHAFLQPASPVVSPGENAVPARRADRRRGMRIGEAHPLANESIDVRRGDFPALRIER